jgi:UDP-N-acetylglucosamine--N-acetylmuramyl-(pentapeptide) pyrophosphoryl-undecaprenol N-acetylglucosamine transferase
MKRIAVVFAGGGSGGHIFPGLAVAEALRDEASHGSEPTQIRCVFVCSERAIDAQILEAAGEAFEPIPARPFSVKPGGLARFVRAWPSVVTCAGRVIERQRADADEVHVIAAGGFAAAPAVRAAKKLGVPITMLNLDASPGKANRWIASHAARVLTTMDVGESDWTLIPPIVRKGAVSQDSPQACRARFGLDPDTPTLLVTGGSQGAGTIARLMIALCETPDSADLLGGWQVIHQAGTEPGADVTAAKDAYARANVRAWVGAFIDDMASALRAADLGISRAGAGSVAEARAAGLPTVFMPYPFHRDQHQRLNAQPLVDAGAAVLADDLIDPARNAKAIGVMLSELLRDEPARASMRESLERLGPTDGARVVACVVLGRADSSAKPGFIG